MLKLRLKKGGRKKYPFYRIVVMNNKAKRDGFAIEEVGFYDPIKKILKIKKKRIYERLKQGVQPTQTLKNLLLKTLNNKNEFY
jgi:small subunit ribosomal protein S16